MCLCFRCFILGTISICHDFSTMPYHPSIARENLAPRNPSFPSHAEELTNGTPSWVGHHIRTSLGFRKPKYIGSPHPYIHTFTRSVFYFHLFSLISSPHIIFKNISNFKIWFLVLIFLSSNYFKFLIAKTEFQEITAFQLTTALYTPQLSSHSSPASLSHSNSQHSTLSLSQCSLSPHMLCYQTL